VTLLPGRRGVPVSFGVAEGAFVPAPAPGFAGLNPPLFPLTGVAVPLGLPAPDGFMPPGGVVIIDPECFTGRAAIESPE